MWAMTQVQYLVQIHTDQVSSVYGTHTVSRPFILTDAFDISRSA